MDHYDPKSFWDNRFLRYGHTGEVDSIVYKYDQSCRLKAVDKALRRSGITIGATTSILDVGCGTGDLINMLLGYAEPEITGIDISSEVIDSVKQRFLFRQKVKFFNMSVENLDFSENKFELIFCINVLQHLISEGNFLKAIADLAKITRIGGHIITMDFSPVKVKIRQPGNYLIIRSRQEYINAFAGVGCNLISDFGLPRLGIRCRNLFYKTAAAFMPENKHNAENISDTSLKVRSADGFKAGVWHAIEKGILGCAAIFDDLLVPYPSAYTDMRILIFKKYNNKP